MINDMKLWTDVRRAVLTGEMSMREACEHFGLNFRTIKKILSHEEPPGYRREVPREKPVLGPFIPIIHQILEADKKSPPKQRHSGKKIFERLRDEHGYTGRISVVRDEIRRYNQRTAEAGSIPCHHRCEGSKFAHIRSPQASRSLMSVSGL